MFVNTVTDLVEWGLHGAPLPRGRAWVLRAGAVVAFLLVWSLASGLVVLGNLFNPIFLAGPWRVLGKVAELAATGHAVGRVDPLLLRAAASLGARRTPLFFRVVLPAALPELLTGIRLGVALSFFVIVISEFIGAEEGLGYLINDGRNFFLVDQMLGAAIVLGLLGYAGNALVVRLGRRWLRWERPPA